MGKISALSTMGGGTVDRTADFLPIVDTSAAATLKVTPNNLLGITGAPVGTTDTQTLTNKVVGNTNTVTLKGSLFTLQDASDTSKQAVFSMSGITTATTRTYTLPNASVTLADTSSAQTFTNKTLTSPTITTPTINNPTLNTDLVSEFTASNGVTVGGVNLKSGALNTNNSVVTANITDSAVTPAKLLTGTGSGWAWTTWTPTWTNLTIGNGVNTARYIQMGKTVHFRLRLVHGTTTVTASTPTFTLPVTANSEYASGGEFPIGQAILLDQGVAFYTGMVNINSATTAKPITHLASGTYTVKTDLTVAIPGGWGNADEWYMTGTYEAA